MELHRGINFSRLEIPADAGGLMFAAGSVVALLLGIPPFRWFLLATFTIGLVVAALVFRWHRGHPAPPPPDVLDGSYSAELTGATARRPPSPSPPCPSPRGTPGE